MEHALKAKYPTKELKREILENRDRITNVEQCMGDYSNHIQRHGDVLDPKLLRHDIILFGEQGDNGLVRQIDKMSDSLAKIESGINRVLWVVILAVIGAVLKLVIT